MAKNRDLLAIGHSAHDYIIRVPEFPKANFSAPITNMKTFNGGAAANVACVGANLGLKTSLVSAVGGDFKKTEYYEHMQKETLKKPNTMSICKTLILIQNH